MGDKKRKKEKKAKESKKKRRKDLSSPKEEVDIIVDFDAAFNVLKPLVLSNDDSSVVDEIFQVIHLIDQGEAIVLDDMDNKDIKQLLIQLFTLLQLKHKKKKYSKPKSLRKIEFLKEFEKQLLHNTSKEVKNSTATTLPIGPSAMPPPLQSVVEDNDDDIVIGPVMVGEKGYREPDAAVVERMNAMEDTSKTWGDVTGNKNAGVTIAQKQRQEWMTSMPDNKTLSDCLGSVGDTKHRQFSKSQEKVEVDQTWFQTPEERKVAEQAKAEMELFGYSKNAVKAGGHSVQQPRSTTTAVDESIMPSVNVTQDERIRKSMEKIRALRGKSLVERHREKLTKGGSSSSAGQQPGWDRERDMGARQNLSKDRVNEILKGAGDMSSRFSAPKMTRQFL